MIEEGGDGEGSDSEVPSLLSYTLRYVSLTELLLSCLAPIYPPAQGHPPSDGESLNYSFRTDNIYYGNMLFNINRENENR